MYFIWQSHLRKEWIIQNDWSVRFGWLGIGDYEAGEESLGQVCEGPCKPCYKFIPIEEGSY